MTTPLKALQQLHPESYWAEDYLDDIYPVLAQWTTRYRIKDDLHALSRCLDEICDLDVTDNAPFAAIWALRSTGALPAMADIDEELIAWRTWIEETYYDGASLNLPPMQSSTWRPAKPGDTPGAVEPDDEPAPTYTAIGESL